MPFRISPDAFAKTAGECVEHQWGLSIRCEACERSERFPQPKLAAMPPGTLIAEIAKRLRCSVCGGQDGTLWLNNANWHPGRS